MTIALLVPVSARDRDDVVAVFDVEDFVRLDRRKLSLGSHGYAQMWDDNLVTLVHRWVMGAKRRDGKIVDHVNGDRLDDRRLNLRFVTAAESSANVKARGVSGFRGVYPMKGKWQARGKQDGRQYHLGTYSTLEEAAQVAHLWRMENLPGYTGRDIAALSAVPKSGASSSSPLAESQCSPALVG
jgi:hypothetical protein